METILSLRSCKLGTVVPVSLNLFLNSNLFGTSPDRRSVPHICVCSALVLLPICPSKPLIMSGTGPRESIFPTRMALTNTKARLKGAQTGHSLLAKKRDALTTRFRAILRKVDEVSHPSLVSK
jgi:hypothetical protein